MAEKSLQELIEQQASQFPEAVAVVCGGEELSYGELNRRANRLARHLRKLGVGPDSPVGLCVSRSFDMAVGVLGIAKAGGCLVPLDPAYPAERLALMAQTVGFGLLLSTQALLGQLPADSGDPRWTTVLLDQDWPAINLESASNLGVDVRPENLLYLLFTSGSTGTPKGVAMPHRALANLIQWQQREIPAGPGQRTLQFAPLSFDVAAQEIFSTWCFGGTLVLVSEADRRNPQALLSMLEAERVERLFLPFAALQLLAEAAQGVRPRFLREVITAGEQLQITPAIAAFLCGPGCRLHNHYGPTESHVVIAYTLPPDGQNWPLLPPIGHPIDNVRVHLLDGAMQEVLGDEAGEMWVGGVCLAHGYYGRPDLTDERFLPDPFGPGRLYKTGDLARRLLDGTIEFLGRADDQVKIRGFRVEPGEIEAMLVRHPQVRAAAVIAFEYAPGLKRLAAYVVPAVDTFDAAFVAGLETDLFAYLQRGLPEHMVPGAFVTLPALPLTPSGKIDRRALPAPRMKRPPLKNAPKPPGNATQALLSGHWQAVLRIDAVGVEDNFFELGGTSLLLAQLHTELALHFPGIDIVALLQYPTVSSLAEHLTLSAQGERQTVQIQGRRADRQAAVAEQRAQRRRYRDV